MEYILNNSEVIIIVKNEYRQSFFVLYSNMSGLPSFSLTIIYQKQNYNMVQ